MDKRDRPGQTRLGAGWAEILCAIRNIRGLQLQAPPLLPVPREGKLPLSFAQQRLWFLNQLEPGSPIYNTSRAYHVTGPLSVAVLTQALHEVVRRHKVLRTTFPTMDGRPVQAIAPTMTAGEVENKSCSLSLVDLQGLETSSRETKALRLVAEEARKPFDLAHGPLFRVTDVRLSQEEHMLLLVSHQILFDGQAWCEFNREVSELYGAFAASKPSRLPELPIQYADFAVWQREWLQGEVLEELLSYWKRQLDGGCSRLALPVDRLELAGESSRCGRQSLLLGRSLTGALKALSQQEGATLFAVLLAAFTTLLHRYTAQEDIVVFSSALGRNRVEVRKLIGLFTNLLPLRIDLSGSPSFRELLGRVRRATLGAYANQDLPFEHLMRILQLGMEPDRASPFQAMFIYRSTPSQPLELQGLTLRPLLVDTGMTKFDLSLSMSIEKGSLAGALTYKTDLFEVTTIARMLEHFRALLEGIVADPDRPLCDLPCLSEAERRQLHVRRNDSQAALPGLGGRACPALCRARAKHQVDFVAPRDLLEYQLKRIWEQVLGIAPIGIHDNFFDLGGHSLLVVRLMVQVQDATGRNLPLAALFHAPTIEQLADVLRQEGWSSPASSLVALEPGGSQTPFFCLPGNLGNVFTDLGGLARHLGSNQPFYGLQDGIQKPSRIDALAARYVDEICTAYPEGPYLLGGVCSGGTIAFEMAQQFTAQGRRVALLAMVETPSPSVPGPRSTLNSVSYILRHAAGRLGRNSRGVTQFSFAERRVYMRLKLKALVNIWELARYGPQPYPGRIHLFLTGESLRLPHTRCLGWREYAAGGIEVHVIPGTHDTVTRTGDAIPEESHVRVLAEQLRTCIDNAGARNDGP